MRRRQYLRRMGVIIGTAPFFPMQAGGYPAGSSQVRLGGPLFKDYDDPGKWIDALQALGYKAAYCPVAPGSDPALVKAYKEAAARNDIIIAEVGAWSNPLSPDPEEAGKAMETCMAGLDLADRIGARCCVNISGSKNPAYWAGPHPENLIEDTFQQVVENTRKIIDTIRPTRTFFTLEAMPWAFPDSTDSYLRLIKAIDRDRFGAHLDPVNMITGPREYFNNGELIRDMFARLGPHIRSCHAKDIILREDNYLPQLDELRPGLGTLDYATYLRELSRLGDVPLMMEHLDTDEEYELAAAHIRSVAGSLNIQI
jgi:sugar phosphate isomerase/epimerase